MGSENCNVSKHKYFDVIYDYVFGKSEPSILDIAMGGAYGDMARHTLVRKKEETAEKDKEAKKEFDAAKEVWKEEIAGYIEAEIKGINFSSEPDFEEWHKTLCGKIIEKTGKNKISASLKNNFTYGQAQKWLNMTLKNALVAGCTESERLEEIKQYFHCPVDSRIVNFAKESGIKIPDEDNKELVWSQWNDYDKYLAFQKDLRDRVTGTEYETLIEWEMKFWPTLKS